MKKFLKTLIPFDIAKGLSITGTYFAKVFLTANRAKVKQHVVSEYPEVPAPLEPRFRGRVQLILDEAGDPKCVCCNACAKACPTGVITIEGGKKEGRKTRIPTRWDYEMERCVFCGFCVEACSFDAIKLNSQFELAAYDREDFSLGLTGAHNVLEPSPVGKFSYSDEA
ncbi:NuoI/complex I 23 kDa subunit family protein [Holophaga foetida]|uniref:NuoI/complex I 23 kDa subunit family protein n=1 Tax=Holophaga foetida TaxID=35839 RepID=UPI0002472195|nr:NADH-quinone oxidoreductase subunit I [Holophaga foetida]